MTLISKSTQFIGMFYSDVCEISECDANVLHWTADATVDSC